MEGITKSIKIDYDMWQLVIENEIKNFSAFVNELIEDALTSKHYRETKAKVNLNNAVKEIRALGFEVEVNIKPAQPTHKL